MSMIYLNITHLEKKNLKLNEKKELTGTTAGMKQMLELSNIYF